MKTFLALLVLAASLFANTTYYVVYTATLRNDPMKPDMVLAGSAYTSSAAITMSKDVLTFNDVMVMRKEVFKVCQQPIDSSTIVIMNFIKLNGGAK
jgi:hypothetical protein